MLMWVWVGGRACVCASSHAYSSTILSLVCGRFGRGLTPVLLVSLPCSGNTWLRYLLEGATGFFTGSQYNDKSLHRDGKLGGHVSKPWRQKLHVCICNTQVTRAKESASGCCQGLETNCKLHKFIRFLVVNFIMPTFTFYCISFSNLNLRVN